MNIAGYGTIARWVYGESENILFSDLEREINKTETTLPLVYFQAEEPGDYVLFDSACSGGDLGDEHLRFVIKPGAYYIKTQYYQADTENRLLSHLFIPSDESVESGRS